uniref:Uncharacterized protein n=1 Tax=Rhizophora mucronata TaxID=61149 RepID=A0A2P2N3R5_RHIMU
MKYQTCQKCTNSCYKYQHCPTNGS